MKSAIHPMRVPGKMPSPAPITDAAPTPVRVNPSVVATVVPLFFVDDTEDTVDVFFVLVVFVVFVVLFVDDVFEVPFEDVFVP